MEQLLQQQIPLKFQATLLPGVDKLSIQVARTSVICYVQHITSNEVSLYMGALENNWLKNIFVNMVS